MIKQALLRFLMRLRANEVTFDRYNGAIFHELFNHPAYRQASAAQQAEIGVAWARHLYQIEVRQPLDAYFPGLDLADYCREATILDLGCYLGGKSLRWLEKYGARRLYGLDVDAKHLSLAARLAAQRQAPANFVAGVGEHIPLAAETIDLIMSVNTFEHVRDPQRVLAECRRLLRPAGYLLVVFPPFHYPVGHHLDLVTRLPCLHWFFSYESLLQAYFHIIDERGPGAQWYRRHQQHPLPFERGYSINGMGARAFHRLIQDHWRILYDGFTDNHHSHSQNPLKRWLDTRVKRLPLSLLRGLYEAVYLLQKV